MHSVLVIFGLLFAFMLVSSLPLGPSILEKRQLGVLGGNQVIGPITFPISFLNDTSDVAALFNFP
ncbi:hypothetical protein RO3G_13588 [Rhizopus delemar RA 99-880]|uniref:Uncharacterized protein n=1 Tax=Rhizopus delemar (strain RA 99-880 / ATCC MYA-4621 / FGSC 9543 / NRRL 43880) TaxID=246409 RepID=I1CK97_RHIO9|nr:hypothetical protein RO3G_13588 [Rhizopus delemar RA 99-880]|eukprot:EIE88877.1 hypothetical protein RO3G_13588 [Rhizopus delemar RA 99-880]